MNIYSTDLFCRDLPSTPRPEIGKILVTGATGYIGGRLVPELLARGYQVRVMVRAASPEHEERWPEAEIVVADALDVGDLEKALTGIHTVYYLIHSLLLGPERFALADIEAAVNFRQIAMAKKIKRIIYLGGLGDDRHRLSDHLKSRMEVARELAGGTVPTTILRTAVIIGSGSASYEIIKHLANNAPVLFIPPWSRNKCQPIAIRDVIKYLVGVLEIPATAGKSFDIGGQDVLTYEMMLKILADLLGKKKIFLPFPVSGIGFLSYLASLLTPVPASITRCLMEGLKNEVVCQDNAIRDFLPFEPLAYREAVVRAMSREEQDNVYTRWSDAYPPAHELALKLRELVAPPRYTDHYSLITDKSAAGLFLSFCRIGGREGWFHSSWMWRLRGMVDRLFMGVGTSRGRRSGSSLKINDVIDFWRVEDLKPDEMLLLRAEMKLPGRAWLQFRVDRHGEQNMLSVDAYYQHRGLLGKIYWYMLLPFHHFIFTDLLKQIEKRS